MLDVITPLMHFQFSLVITPFLRYYAFYRGGITPFNFFSLQNLMLIGFRML